MSLVPDVTEVLSYRGHTPVLVGTPQQQQHSSPQQSDEGVTVHRCPCLERETFRLRESQSNRLVVKLMLNLKSVTKYHIYNHRHLHKTVHAPFDTDIKNKFRSG